MCHKVCVVYVVLGCWLSSCVCVSVCALVGIVVSVSSPN